jgi:mycothiol system anti-sigma-R factor
VNCKESLLKLYEFLDGDLAKISVSEIEVHLDNCRHCWDRFEFEKRLKELVKTSCCKTTCPDALRERIKELIEKF